MSILPYLGNAPILAEVVPEFDLPGHSQAAIASYPELGNNDSSEHWEPQVATSFGALPYTLSPSEKSVNFTKDKPDASSFQGVWPSMPTLSHLDSIMSHPAPMIHCLALETARNLGMWELILGGSSTMKNGPTLKISHSPIPELFCHVHLRFFKCFLLVMF